MYVCILVPRDRQTYRSHGLHCLRFWLVMFGAMILRTLLCLLIVQGISPIHISFRHDQINIS